jgi:hypothetical protein
MRLQIPAYRWALVDTFELSNRVILLHGPV